MAGLWGVQYAKDDRQTLRHLAEVMVRSPYFDMMKFFFKLIFHNTADQPLTMSDFPDFGFTFPLFFKGVLEGREGQIFIFKKFQ